MKKFITILILITLLIPFLGFYQVNGETTGVKRKVLMELFTATWCGPCAVYAPYVDETYDMYGLEKVILLRNQIGNDGLDTEETNNRSNFYGVTGIPDLYVNGKYEYHPAYYSEYRSKINEILKTISPISIKIDAKITKDKNLGNIYIEIEVFDNINIKSPQLIVTLFEKLVNYEGTNKEKTHRFVIRDYIYDEVGEKLNLKKGEKYKFNLPLIVKSGVNLNDFGIAAWVQDFSTLEVIQAEASDINVINNPTPPLIISPKDNQIFNDFPVVKILSNFGAFKIQLSDKEDFKNIIIDKPIKEKELTLDELKDEKTYFIRIKSIDGTKESEWSNVIKFIYSKKEKFYGFSNINYNLYGGNLDAFAQDPKDAKILYIGSHGGGIYKSTDGGENWFNSSFGLECLYVNYIDIDKNNTNNILTATDKGLYISYDAGNSWINHGLSYIQKVSISPDSKIIYAQSTYYLYKSNDYGKSWVNITPIYSDLYYLDTFSCNLTNALIIFLGIHSDDDYYSHLYYTNNSGVSWSEIKLKDIFKNCNIRNIKIYEKDTNIVYLSTFGSGIYKSTNGGISFEKINSPSDYINKIKIDFNDKNILYILLYNSLYRSYNGGSSWTKIYSENVYLRDIFIDIFDSSKLYLLLDYGDGLLSAENRNNEFIWNKINTGINCNKIIGISSYDELLISTNTAYYKFNTNNWKLISDIKIPEGKFLINRKNTKEICFFSRGIIYYSNNGGINWTYINNPPDNTFLDIDIDFKNHIIYSITEIWNENKHYISRYNISIGRLEKIDAQGIPLTSPPYRYAIKIDQNNPNILYIGIDTYWDKDSSGNPILKGGGFYKSEDSGKSWKLISLKEEIVYNIFIDPKDSNKIYVNTSDGIKRSTDSGKSWKLIFNENVNDIAFSLNSSIIYGARGRNLIKSEDDGVTWTYIPWDYSINLVKPSNIISLSIDKKDPNTVYIGTDGCGIYKYGVIEYIEDTQPPYLNITSPTSNNVLTNNNKITIIGTTYDNESGIMSLTINEKKVNVSKEGIFTYDIDLIEGENKIKIISTDNEGNKTEKELKVICDLTPPVINLNIPTETSNQSLSLEGVITDNLSGVKYLKINNSEVSVSEGIKFTYKINLNEGENIILIEVEDNANNKTKKEYFVKYTKQIVIKLQIGNLFMYVNDIPQEIDVPPTIVEGRTLLPIRWVAEPLGAEVGWDGNEKKVTVKLKNTTIELWIGKNIAKVNGVNKPIDPDNSKVVPMIINGRTMLPIRFVAENIGCDVKWDGVTKTVTITYPAT